METIAEHWECPRYGYSNYAGEGEAKDYVYHAVVSMV
jgi:hypothetical protein